MDIQMKLLLWGLVLGQAGLYLIQRFVVQKYSREKWIYRIILTILVWQGLGVWFIYRGFLTDFLSFNIIWFIACLVAPCLLYVLSLLIVGTQMSKENLFPVDSFRLKGKLKTAFVRESLFNIYSSTYEELLYRWFLQNALYLLTRSAVVSIVITSSLFFLVHVNKQIAIVQMADILLFSVAITLFFHWSINPIYCIIIHIARNQLIICQKYVQKNKDRKKMAQYMRLLGNRHAYSEMMK